MAAMLAACVAPVHARQPFSIEDEVHRWMPMTLGRSCAISSSGKLAASVTINLADRKSDEFAGIYVTSGASLRALGARILILDAESGSRIAEIAAAGSSNYAIAWSPVRDELAFYSDAGGTLGLAVWSRGGGVRRIALPAMVRQQSPIDLPVWSPDGRKIATRILGGGISNPGFIAKLRARTVSAAALAVSHTRREYHFDPKAGPYVHGFGKLPEAANADLIVVDTATGSVQHVVSGQYVPWVAFSPDSRRLAYTRYERTDPKHVEQTYYSICIADLESGQTVPLVADVPMQTGRSVSWAPAGGSLAYVTQIHSEQTDSFARSDLYSVAIDGSAPRSILQDLFTGAQSPERFSNRGPIWSGDGNSFFVPWGGGVRVLAAESGREERTLQVPAGRVLDIVLPQAGNAPAAERLVVVTGDPGKTLGYGAFDLVTDKYRNIWQDRVAAGSPRTSIESGDRDVSRGGERLIFVREGVVTPPGFWVANADSSRARPLFESNPDLQSMAFGEMRSLSYRTADGKLLNAALLLPPGFRDGMQIPLIVRVYPGIGWADPKAFGTDVGPRNLHLLTARGYGVLIPDSSIAAGHPVDSLARCIVPAVLHVINLGIADPERIGITGHSQGGMSAVALLTKSRLFRAAVVSGGYYDLLSFYGGMDGSGFSGGALVMENTNNIRTTPWKNRRVFEENNPVLELDRIETPLLLVHGLEDGVPASQSEEVFVGLRQLGKKASLVEYPGSHVPGDWATDDQIDYSQRMLRWFDEHLRIYRTD